MGRAVPRAVGYAPASDGRRPSHGVSMINNDVLRSVRYMLAINDLAVARIFELGGCPLPMSEVASYFEEEGTAGYRECGNRAMAHFLDGLIVYRRGQNDAIPMRPVDPFITNNTILKKLRVAFALKDDDMLEIMRSANLPVSKPELSALFRSPGHPNYRVCGDQFLRNFLRSLTLRVRGEL